MARFLLNLSIFSQPFLVCCSSSTRHSFPVLLPSSASGSRTVLPGCSFSVTTESPCSCLTPCPGLLALLRLQPLEEKLSQCHIVTHHLSADSSRLLVRERTRARYAWPAAHQILPTDRGPRNSSSQSSADRRLQNADMPSSDDSPSVLDSCSGWNPSLRANTAPQRFGLSSRHFPSHKRSSSLNSHKYTMFSLTSGSLHMLSSAENNSRFSFLGMGQQSNVCWVTVKFIEW